MFYMKKVFRTLIVSSVVGVMYSCGSDIDFVAQQNNVSQTGELQVNFKSGDSNSGAKPSANAEDAIKNLHFFIFKTDKWETEDYLTQTLNNGEEPKIFSAKPSIGHKRFAIVANCATVLGFDETNAWVDLAFDGKTIADLTGFYATKVHLSSQTVGDFTMVGEQNFEIKKGLNETSINLTRLVAKVVLKSVTVDSDYANSIQIKRAFMMNVNGVSWMRGTTTGDYEYHDPISNGFVNQGQYAEGYLSQLSSIFTAPYTAPVFYVFENKGKRYVNSEFNDSAKTMLVIEADYKKKSGEIVSVYYSIVLKTGEDEKVLRNNAYTLSATIKRPGSLNPEEPSLSGDLEVRITVDPWETNDEQNESFE